MMISSDFWKHKKVFITGYTGFKASWLCLWLHRIGENIVGYALNPPTDPSLFELCKIGTLVQSTIADVRDGAALTNAMLAAKPEIVLHMAWPRSRSCAIPIRSLSRLTPSTSWARSTCSRRCANEGDDFVFNNNHPVDFIKCDVEGAELFVFQGGISSIIQAYYLCRVVKEMGEQV